MRGKAGKRESAGGKMEHGDAAPMSATWMIGLRGPEGHRYSFIHSTFPEASLAKGSAVAVVSVYQRFCSDAPCFPAVPGGGRFSARHRNGRETFGEAAGCAASVRRHNVLEWKS